MKWISRLVTVCLILLACGCAERKSYDYTAFKQSRPRSILVLPALNETNEINANASFISQTIYPLAESGYYVFPVAVVEETFKQNGIISAQEIHEIPFDKLRDIFAADAALYIKILNYGTSYMIIDSATRVTVSAQLRDLKTGTMLWQGQASASSTETDTIRGGGGLLTSLVIGLAKQIGHTITDKSYEVAGMASLRLLLAKPVDGAILYGPYSPKYYPEQ